ESARQLSRLVANTLTLMRADNFRQTLQPSAVELAVLLRKAVHQGMPFVQVRKQQLAVEISHDLGIFEGDPDKTSASLVNLLTNAIKFTPDGGELALRAALAGPEEARIQVTDRGIGLEPRAVKRLFQPFFTQFDSSHHSSGDFGFNKRGLGL